MAAPAHPQPHGQLRSDHLPGHGLGPGSDLLQRHEPENAERRRGLLPEPRLVGWQQAALGRESHGHRARLPGLGHCLRDTSSNLDPD